MLHVVLYEPEIPPNTGNIMRLCANTGARLHLIEPLGFSLNEKALRRAGLDYRDRAVVTLHCDWEAFLKAFEGERIFAMTTRATRRYADVGFRDGDALLFGPETRGLPDPLLTDAAISDCLRLPMHRDSRSLNLSNAVAVGLFEALRQLGFPELF
jgi:tRNA (cytidine(34)-2'-O)-methyltransferase